MGEPDENRRHWLEGPYWAEAVDRFTPAHARGDLGPQAVTLTRPGQWQVEPRLPRGATRVVYRLDLGAQDLPAGARRFLVLPGTFYTVDVYLDGTHLGSHSGYFGPLRLELPPLSGASHRLVLEVACPLEPRGSGKTMITGIFSHWDCLDRDFHPGGPWLLPWVEATGATRIRGLGIRTVAVDPDPAVELAVDLEGDAPRGSLQVTVEPLDPAHAGFSFELDPRTGLSVLKLPGAARWWPWVLGSPARYRVKVALPGSDRRSLVTGFRTLERTATAFRVNGVPLFLMGANYGPSSRYLGQTTMAQVRRDMELARAAGLNALRVHAHVDHPDLYAAADEAGMLLWQDMPLQWGYRDEVEPQARSQVHEMVSLLHHHPAIFLWCMHNEPIHMDETLSPSLGSKLRTLWSVAVFSRNRERLDRRLAAVARRLDPGRTVLASSNVLTPWDRRGDAHLYCGWYREFGPWRLADLLFRRAPRMVGLLSEFGAQSFPDPVSCRRFLPGTVAPDAWEHLAIHHAAQPENLARIVDLARPVAELAAVTQRHQRDLHRFYIERCRWRTFRPGSGFFLFFFRDCQPAVTWSILDAWGRPKLAYDDLTRLLSPLHAGAIVPLGPLRPGRRLRVPLYAVNGTDRDERGARLTARLLDAKDHVRCAHRAAGSLSAHGAAVDMGTLVIPPLDPGSYQLQVVLDRVGGPAPPMDYELVVAG